MVIVWDYIQGISGAQSKSIQLGAGVPVYTRGSTDPTSKLHHCTTFFTTMQGGFVSI